MFVCLQNHLVCIKICKVAMIWSTNDVLPDDIRYWCKKHQEMVWMNLNSKHQTPSSNMFLFFLCCSFDLIWVLIFLARIPWSSCIFHHSLTSKSNTSAVSICHHLRSMQPLVTISWYLFICPPFRCRWYAFLVRRSCENR